MSVQNETYIVAGHNSWNREHFNEIVLRYSGQWFFISEQDELTIEYVQEKNPTYIFFLHWSYIVPASLHEKWDCICFHMTDVPYGRGGSPLQNLIVRGHETTMLTALRMSDKLDEGPVYLKKSLVLSGTAEAVYMRASKLSCEMISEIIGQCNEPVDQVGVPVHFKRRKPEESELASGLTLETLNDFIRMLDAEGYPRAYVDIAGFRLSFSRSASYNGIVKADVEFKRIQDGGDR